MKCELFFFVTNKTKNTANNLKEDKAFVHSSFTPYKKGNFLQSFDILTIENKLFFSAFY